MLPIVGFSNSCLGCHLDQIKFRTTMIATTMIAMLAEISRRRRVLSEILILVKHFGKFSSLRSASELSASAWNSSQQEQRQRIGVLVEDEVKAREYRSVLIPRETNQLC